MSSKEAYFQGGGGVNEPAPKHKKYKSEPNKPVQTRNKKPLFRNYDYAGPESEISPGEGLYKNIDKYKSVTDFLNKKRKKKANSRSKIKLTRKLIFFFFFKNTIDFPIDDQIHSLYPFFNEETVQHPLYLGPEGPPGDLSTFPSSPNLGDSPSYNYSAEIGGGLPDPYPDFEGKNPYTLNFGRDYVEDVPNEKIKDIEKMLNKFLNPAESELFGLPGGVGPIEDLDAPSDEDPDYGIMESGNTLYNKISF